jgi:hypothetical protein
MQPLVSIAPYGWLCSLNRHICDVWTHYRYGVHLDRQRKGTKSQPQVAGSVTYWCWGAALEFLLSLLHESA